MTKHTPGPWRMEVDHLKGYRIVGCGATPIMSGNCEIGDARILAAAPKMLEALKTMTALAKLKYGNLDVGVWQEICATEKLIAKAEGRE